MRRANNVEMAIEALAAETSTGTVLILEESLS